MELKKTYGLSGTDIYSGYIDEDYNPVWRGQTKVDLVDEMRKSDGTIAAISDSFKTPLLSTGWYIEAGGKSKKDREIADFVDKMFFTDMNFKAFLEEALLFVDYGYYLFEVIYCVRDGMICVKSLEARVPKSIEKWQIGSQKWVDGHPSGVTQYLDYTDEVRSDEKGRYTTAEIPWDKLLILTHKQTGKNYEGESIFRRCYSHWVIKQKLYKIAAVAAERFGSGTPFFKLKQGTSENTMTKYEKIAKNIRSNELAGLAITEDVVDWGIMIPQGTNSVATMLDTMVRHHDKKMYDAILAGFLNLTSGDGGSNALSKDQSDFFIMSVSYIATKVQSVLNDLIKKVVIMNYGVQEYYPTIEFGELNEKNMKEVVESLATAVNAGLVQWGDLDEDRAREMLDLAHKSDVVIIEKEGAVGRGEDKEKPSMPKESEDTDEDIEDVDDIDDAKDVEETKREVEVKKLAVIQKVPAYEKSFSKSIGDYENYLNSEYSNYALMAEEAEGKYRAIMHKALDKAEKERKDGVEILVANTANTKLWKETSKEIDLVTKRLEKKWLDSAIQERLFKKSVQMASLAYDGFSVSLSEVDEVKVAGMVRGYKSNIAGVLFNDPRRVKEQMDIILTAGTELETARNAVDDMVIFNRNVLQLSVQAHARATFNTIVYDSAVAGGFTFFKVLAPKQKLKDINPTGMTMGILFAVMTAFEINRYANEQTDGKNPSAVQGLGLHHNSYEYYMPVPTSDVEEQKELGKQQKEDVLANID